MKANAPEKLYLLPRQGGDYTPYWKTDSQDGFGIEYIRIDALTDALIEKACEYLDYKVKIILCGDKTDTDKFIDEFRKYMKGE